MSETYVYMLFRDDEAKEQWSLRRLRASVAEVAKNSGVELALIGAIPFYVGIGQRGRWLVHESDVRHNKRSRNVYKDRIIKKLLKTQGEIKKLKLVENLHRSDAKALEIALIAALGRKQDGGPLTNRTLGGDGGAILLNPNEYKRRAEKRSTSLKAYYAIPKNKEKHIKLMNRPEMKAKLRDAAIKQHSDPAQREANRQRGIAQYSTKEARQAQSERITKSHSDPAVRAKMSLAKKGKTHPRKGIPTGKPAWNKGLKTGPASEERRKKQSETMKKLCENPKVREKRHQAAMIRWYGQAE